MIPEPTLMLPVLSVHGSWAKKINSVVDESLKKRGSVENPKILRSS